MVETRGWGRLGAHALKKFEQLKKKVIRQVAHYMLDMHLI